MVVSTCTEQTVFDTSVAVYSSSEGQCNDLTCENWQTDDRGACPSNRGASTVYFSSTEGRDYYVAIIGVNGGTGTFGIKVSRSA